jgi:aryl-alcohol dehydrogenase-like predicted oxidoreductase
MEYTQLGTSDLKVSRLTLGCMSFGTPNQFQDWALDGEAAGPLFRQAVELGINFWDTANVYGMGSSEEIVGRAMREYSSREQTILATKIYWPMHDGPTGGGLSRNAILEQVDASLARLGIEAVDLMQIHRFDPEVAVEETMEALHDVVQAGKVRYIGASSMWAWQFAKMQSAAEQNGWTKFVSMQDQYNLVQREEEREMHGILADQGVGNMVWSPLGGGIVARPWGDKSSTRAASTPDRDQFGRPLFLDSDKAIVDAVERIATERGVAMAIVALAWVLKNPVVDTPIIGATKAKHLADAAAALELTLSDEEVAALEAPYTPRQPTFF